MSEEEDEVNFKKWFIKVLALMAILGLLIYGIQFYLAIKIVFDVLVAITLVLIVFFLHEYLHYFTALRLGYRPEWYRTRFMMGFEIDTKNKKPKFIEKEKKLSVRDRKEYHLKENKKIAIAPYYICFPISILFILIGWHFDIIGFLASGCLLLIGHIITLPMEAKVL